MRLEEFHVSEKFGFMLPDPPVMNHFYYTVIVL